MRRVDKYGGDSQPIFEGFHYRIQVHKHRSMSDLSAFRAHLRSFAASKEYIAPWAERYPMGRLAGSTQGMVADILGALTKLAGGDVSALLRALVPLRDAGHILQAVAPEAYTSLRLMSKPFNALGATAKHDWVQCMRGRGTTGSHFGREDAIALGWEISKRQWTSDSPSAAPEKRGRKSLAPDLAADVHDALITSSTQSRTKRIKVDNGDPMAVQRMQMPFVQVYHDFPRRDELSLRSFYNLIGSQFKQRGLVRDACDYCQDATVARHSIAHLKAQYPDVANKSVEQILVDHGNQSWQHALANKVDIIMCADAHRNKDTLQRVAYEHICADPHASVLGIALDWKAKESVPICATETSAAAYGKSQLAVLCVHFFWHDGVQRQDAFCTAVSKTVTENSYCSIAGLKRSLQKMIDMKVFDPHQFNTFEVWTDAGRHFMSYEFLHYILKDLPAAYNVVVTHNFFAEKHGKSHCDGYFNCLGSYILRVLHEKDIVTASDYVAAIEKGWRLVKASNELRGLPSQLVVPFVLSVPTTGTYNCMELEIIGVTSICCFHGRPDGVVTFSENAASPVEISIKSRIRTATVQYTLTVSEQKPMKTPEQRACTLRKKQQKLTELIGTNQPAAAYVMR